MLAALFAGQGSQKRGMGESLFGKYKDVVQAADDILGYSVIDYCLNASNERLNDTRFAQPAIYTVNALKYYEFEREATGEKPDYFLGHSLGEYNALLAAGVFDFGIGLNIVKRRAELMSQVRGTGMAAVLGLSLAEIKDVITRNNLSDIYIANVNTPNQTVVAGSLASLNSAEEVFFDNFAVNYVLLNVSGAFHTSYMDRPVDEFETFLSSFEFESPRTAVISNLTAKPYQRDDCVRLLSQHINSPVMWQPSVEYLRIQGVERFIELSETKTLTDMIKYIK